MKITDLKTGMMVKEGGKLLQIGDVTDTYVTVTVLLAGRPATAPDRTTVRHYCAEDVELLFDRATPGQLRRLAEVYAR